MYCGRLALWLLLTTLCYLAPLRPLLSVLAIGLLHFTGTLCAERLLSLYGAAFLILPFVLGSACAQSVVLYSKDEDLVIRQLFGLVLVGCAQLIAILGSQRLRAWLRYEEVNSRTKPSSSLGIDQLIFPLFWFFCHEILPNHNAHGFIGTQASLYPIWLATNNISTFLDAIVGQCLSELILRGTDELQGQNLDSKDEKQTAVTLVQPSWHSMSVYQILQLPICILLSIHGAGMIFASSVKHNPNMIQIGCVHPQDHRSTVSVLTALRQQVASGNDISLLPATAAYINNTPDFLKFKEDILRVTSQKTVVVPTHDFREEKACERMMHLQVYPLNEEKFLNSYSVSRIKAAVGDVKYERNMIGSLFLTWRSRQARSPQRSLLVATAICLDEEYPNVFLNEHSPDLLLIPNSAWSQKVSGSRIDLTRALVKRTGTAALYCDQGQSGYIDPTGRVITHSSKNSFSIQYDQSTNGELYSLRPGFWWTIVPILLVAFRIMHRLQVGNALNAKNRVQSIWASSEL